MSSMSGNTGYSGVAGPNGRTGNKTPSGYKSGQLAQFTPEQMKLFSEGFDQVSPDSYTSRLARGDQSLFGEMEAPALKQHSALQGGLASRFSGMGSFGGRNSSGFKNMSNAASSDFAMQLQSNRQGLQRQAIQDLRSMSNELLNQRPYENYIAPKQKTFGQEFALATAPALIKGGFSMASGGGD
jgi:hypothetical protein